MFGTGDEVVSFREALIRNVKGLNVISNISLVVRDESLLDFDKDPLGWLVRLAMEIQFPA